MLFQIFILEARPDLHEMTCSDMRKHTVVNNPPRHQYPVSLLCRLVVCLEGCEPASFTTG